MDGIVGSSEPGGRRFDAICANPPYISDDEWPDVAPNVKEYEPAAALRGGPDGLDIIRPIIAGAGDLLRSEGRLAVEIAHAQHDEVLALVRSTGVFDHVTVLKDHEGLWRVLIADRK